MHVLLGIGKHSMLNESCDVCQLFLCLGDLIVDVTEECSCQGECYRMSYWESYFEKITDARGHTKVEEKVCRVVKVNGWLAVWLFTWINCYTIC